MRLTYGVGLLVFLAACARTPDGSDTAAAKADTGGMADMPGMGGMGGMMSGAMMDSMQTHMRMMDTVTADQMKAMTPMHRQMMGNMLAQMNREMQSMNMTGDARWTALLDSVRQDLVRMPDMNAQQMRGFMPQHRERATRLMQMHRDMMAEMHK